MTPYLVAFGFIIVGFTFMAGMLHFAQWKKKEGSCGCGRSMLAEEEYLLSGKLPTGASCSTCPNKDKEDHD